MPSSPISSAYAFREGAPLDVAQSVNATLLRDGMAYPLAYDTQPDEHRALFAGLARAARSAGRGVWRLDRTPAFTLATEASIGPRGALIFPKLFRRCVGFFGARLAGFRGGIRAWLEGEGGRANDVVIAGGRLVRLSELIVEADRAVRTRVDATAIVFVAR